MPKSKTMCDTKFIIPDESRTDDTLRSRFIRQIKKCHQCPKCGHQWEDI